MKVRIYIDNEIQIGAAPNLTAPQIHYLKDVMRMKSGDKFIVFGGGAEYVATMESVLEKTNATDSAGKFTLAFCPIKPAPLAQMIDMATQLGVVALQPVISARTDIPKMNFDRFAKIATEAAEQSGRLSVPEILPAIKFADFVRSAKNVFFGDERPGRQNLTGAVPDDFTFFIGPQGGFSPDEFAAMDAAGWTGFSLGRTILRAETAAVAGIAKLLTFCE